MTPRRIELHIEELVLEGFRPADRFRIAAALESELGRLVAGRAAADFRADGAPSIDAGSFPLRPGAPPAEVGRQVARTLVGGLTR